MKKVKENKFSRLLDQGMVEKIQKHMLTSIRGAGPVESNGCLASQTSGCGCGNNLCTCPPPRSN